MTRWGRTTNLGTCLYGFSRFSSWFYCQVLFEICSHYLRRMTWSTAREAIVYGRSLLVDQGRTSWGRGTQIRNDTSSSWGVAGRTCFDSVYAKRVFVQWTCAAMRIALWSLPYSSRRPQSSPEETSASKAVKVSSSCLRSSLIRLHRPQSPSWW